MGSLEKPSSSPLLTPSTTVNHGHGYGHDHDHDQLPPSTSATTHGVDARLESILTDASLPCRRRAWCALGIELRLLLALAAPAVAAYMINYVMSMSTQIFSGHLGNLELAAASLGNSGIQIFAFGLMRGHAYRAPAAELGGGVQGGLGPLGGLAGAEPELLDHSGAQFVYIAASPRCRLTWTGFSWQAFAGLGEFFKLSAASAVMLCLEAWYFQVLVLIAGLLENPELALDSLSVCMTLSGWVFMISVGFNAAASVRVSNELGAGNPKSAAFSVLVVTVLSSIISVILAIVILCLRDYISYIFTEGETVARAVSDLCPLLAVTLILNGIQPVLSGVAVGCGWQQFVAYVNVGCYYIFGVPLGVLLGFKFNLGAKGIWGGMIGGTFMQTLILLWVTFRTDWNKEVQEAMKRLDKWEDKKQPLLSNDKN
uniref:Protein DETOXIFICATION n=1 Tax=Ananas comosus var. bracteatus TaxID=296719 RepID=A0A6V7QDU6_ANACO|nr:unnamed protein product [Ananas comosus var. bracteatus]